MGKVKLNKNSMEIFVDLLSFCMQDILSTAFSLLYLLVGLQICVEQVMLRRTETVIYVCQNF